MSATVPLLSAKQSSYKGAIESCSFPLTLKVRGAAAPCPRHIDVTTLTGTHLHANASISARTFDLIQRSWAHLIARYCPSDSVISFSWFHDDQISIQNTSLPLLPEESLGLSIFEKSFSSSASSSSSSEGESSPSPPADCLGQYSTWKCSVSGLLSSKIKTLIDYSGQLAFIEAGFEAGLQVIRGNDGGDIILRLMFDESKMDAAFADCLVDNYRSVLAAVTEAGEAHLQKHYSLPGRSDLAWIKEFNSSSLFQPHQECVHDAIQRNIQSYPTKDAICAWDGQCSYETLGVHSTNLARHLQTLGVGPGSWIPVMLEKTALIPIVLLAILKTGAAFIPLPPGSPSGRLRDILEDSKARLFVCSMEQAATIQDLPIERSIVSHALLLELMRGTSSMPISEGQTKCQTSTPASLPEVSREDLERHIATPVSLPQVSYENPMLCLYTSGSTGRPKGVIMQHRGFSTQIFGSLDSVGHDHWRVMQSASLAFDASMWQVFSALLLGGCVCVPHDNECTADVATAITKYNVETISCVPSYAALINPEDTPTLRRILVGGEVVADEVIQRWSGAVRLVNVYGPAEACVVSTARVYDKSKQSTGNQIGTPLATHRAVIVSTTDPSQLMPVGAVGELLIASPCLAQGYLNNGHQTRLAFIGAPEWSGLLGLPDERRYYRTGDLVQYDVAAMDGSLIFVGRRDDQVKLRGQRLELGEIEHHIKQLPDIGAVAVLVPKAGPLAEQLVAVVQEGLLRYTNSSHEVRVMENRLCPQTVLAEQMARRLPGYMIPTCVLQVEDIPTTMSQKIDRRRLKMMIEDPDFSYHDTSSNLAASEALHADEAVALNISKEILSRCSKRRGSTFSSAIQDRNIVLSDSGLDSIDLISVSAFVQRTYGLRLPKAMLFSNNVDIRQIARYIEAPADYAQQNHSPGMQEDVQALKQAAADVTRSKELPTSRSSSEVCKVFLTGATGYLGSELLRILLCDYQYSVIALVRGPSVAEAKQKLVERAERDGWWQPQRSPQLDIWLGDLGQQSLGLDDQHYSQLINSDIDVIVHNGAIVNYQFDYSKIRGVNVLSTAALLRVLDETRKRQRQQHFVYVSGGLEPLLPSAENDNHKKAEVAKIEKTGSGYSRSKLASELLIKEYAATLESDVVHTRITIARPGYIVGTPDQRVGPVTSDFLWRLIAGCVSLQAVCEEHLSHWVYLASVTEVAKKVLNPLAYDKGACHQSVDLINALDGMRWQDLIDIIAAEFGFVLRPLPRSLWLSKLQVALDRDGEAHPLFPFVYTLNDQFQPFSSSVPSHTKLDADQKLAAAGLIIPNVRTLMTLGLIKQQE